jgi:rhamnogalacturonan endolyase
VPNRNGSEFAKGDDYFHDGMGIVYALQFPDDVNFTVGKSDFRRDWFYLQVPHASEQAIAAATVEAQPRPMRIPGARGARRGGATQPAAAPTGEGGAPPAPPAGARRGFGAAGLAGGGGGGGRATPWTINFDLPSAPRGKATLRLGIATSNINGAIAVDVNGKSVGAVDRLANDSAIGRNGISGIWYEREVAFDASAMHAGANKLVLTVPPGGMTSGVIYDYLRLELDENGRVN